MCSKKMYRRRLAVEAEQFWPSKKPWPEGVSYDYTKKMYRIKIENCDAEIRPGEWVIQHGRTYNVTTANNFAVMYELVKP